MCSLISVDTCKIFFFFFFETYLLYLDIRLVLNQFRLGIILPVTVISVGSGCSNVNGCTCGVGSADTGPCTLALVDLYYNLKQCVSEIPYNGRECLCNWFEVNMDDIMTFHTSIQVLSSKYMT